MRLRLLKLTKSDTEFRKFNKNAWESYKDREDKFHH